jgi:serine/threonine protein phosphatase PrpC
MLICSDGLTDIDLNTYYDEFESIIGGNIDDLRGLCEKLLAYALDKGSADNISIIAVLFQN